MKVIYYISVLSLIFAASCKNNQTQMKENNVKPPVAEKVAKELVMHDDVRVDDYFWMRLTDEQKNAEVKDEQTQKVYDYLNAENDYYDKMTSHIKTFQDDLFEEMKSRIKEDDESVPYKKNGYYYITRFEKGNQYPIHSRKKENLDAKEEILFDVNELAKGYDYFKLVGLAISPNNKIAAFGTDNVSRRLYTIQFKNLETGELYPDIIEGTSGASAWSSDNKTVFYTKKNPTTLRGEKIYKHILGTDSKGDKEVYYEEDDTFSTYVYKTKSQKYIVIGSHSTLSNEFRVLLADQPNGKLKIIQPRERDLEYSLAHYKDHFYILTNKDDAKNFKLMKTPETLTTKENWVDVIPHREDVLLEDISIFKNYLVLEERSNGLNKIRISSWDGKVDYFLPFDEEAYSAGVHFNPEFDTEIIRYSYTSMTTPSSVIDFDMKNKTKEIKKEQEILGGKFDKNNYKSERIWATARDGKKVAISLVYRKKHNNLEQNTIVVILLWVLRLFLGCRI